MLAVIFPEFYQFIVMVCYMFEELGAGDCKNMSPMEFLGVITMILFGTDLLRRLLFFLYDLYVKPRMVGDILAKYKGTWAVITGGTDGIGKAYAHALAAKGLNIVLISRDLKRLDTCAAELVARYTIQTRVFVTDFTKTEEIYEDIAKALSGLEIGVLVNNIGISYSYPEYFLDLPERSKFIMNLIRANVVAVTKMSEVVLPGMIAREKGVIINISSASALFPSPMLTVYAATKSYVEKFSEDLRHEYRSKGIIIQTVLPGYVATKMARIRKSTLLAPSPEVYVKSALSKLGVIDHTCGYFPHSFFVAIVVFFYQTCPGLCVRLISASMRKTRQRSLAAHRRRIQEH